MNAKEFLEQNGVPDRPIFGRKPKGQMPEYSANLSELMEEYSNQSKWISVEDRLPNAHQVVMVYHYDGIDILQWLDGSGSWYHYEDGVVEFDVTHWQPLPEAP